MSEPVLFEPALLFRFQVQLFQHDLRWSKAGLNLSEQYRLPSFSQFGEHPTVGELRLAWNTTGLGFVLKTSGKKKIPWCRDSRPTESDGLQILLDTRDSGLIHRANRYCHHLVLSPFGAGAKRDQPFAALIPIDRAREQPNPIESNLFKLFSKTLADGYLFSGIIPANQLTGFDPVEYPRMRMLFQIRDHELEPGEPMTFGWNENAQADPSMWVNLRMTGAP